jgi:hypothetical protein
LAGQKTELDKSEAIANFAEQALIMQTTLKGTISKWFQYFNSNLPSGGFPRYATSKESETTYLKAIELGMEAGKIIGSIEQLYAPQEAIETKKKLLAEGDSLSQAFEDLVNFYAIPDYYPVSLFNNAYDFIREGFGETDRTIRRELTDLLLEYKQ